MKNIIIGLDADTDKIGCCIWNREKRTLEPKSLKFFDIFDMLQSFREDIHAVNIECGFLNKSVWHKARSVAATAKIAKDVGANEEVSRKLIEACQYLQISYKKVKPLKKIWKSTDGKITHEELLLAIKPLELTITTKKTNQDNRDATLIALYG